MTDLAALQKTLGVTFKDISLLEQALIHSSYCNENPVSASTSNERLEFLGDAVLGLIIAEKLYIDNPDFSEGKMTKFRAALVRRETLAGIAKHIKLGDYLYMGKGEELSGGRNKSANLASAMEAVIAAVFLDGGMTGARSFILRLFNTALQLSVNQNVVVDYKSDLQEILQAGGQETPTYHVIETTGPDHGKTFTIEVRLGNTVLGKGSGKSKKSAEAEAARGALEKLPINFTH
ncbi:ribonuclease III [Chloroflexota bacterium]